MPIGAQSKDGIPAWSLLLAGAMLLAALAACSMGTSKSEKEAEANAAKPPVYHVGDSLTYDENGGEEPIFVTAVEPDQIHWTNNAGARWITFADPTIPPRAETPHASQTSTLRFFRPEKPTVFPLVPGKKVEYAVTTSLPNQSNPVTEHDVCETSAPRPMTVEAGTFDAWEIVCQRGAFTEVFYYAPKIGAVLLKRRETPDNVRRKTLVDYHKAEKTVEAASAPPPKPVKDNASRGPVIVAEPLPLARPPSNAPSASPTSAPPKAPPKSSVPMLKPAAPTLEVSAPSQVASAPASRSTTPPAAQHRAASATPTAPSALSGHYAVQVGAFKSYNEANLSWHRMHDRLPQLLGNFAPHLETTTSASGAKFVRVLVGPFDGERTAGQLCGALQTAGQDCWVRLIP